MYMDHDKNSKNRLIIDINKTKDIDINKISNIKASNLNIWKTEIGDMNKLIEYGQNNINEYLQALQEFVDKISCIPILQTEYMEAVVSFSVDAYMVTIADNLLTPLLLDNYENSFIEDKELFEEIRKSMFLKLNNKYNK